MADHKTDPLAEAEVYMAYGCLEQAAQVLREAIKHEPNRKDLWDKLEEIIRRKPSVGASPTASFMSSSGYRRNADGTEVFKIGRMGKIILFIVSILFFGGGLGGISSGEFNWILVLVISILYILFVINILSYSIKLTEDQMIISSLVRSRYFSYAEIGMISYGGGGRGGYHVDIYNKEGKRVFMEMSAGAQRALAVSLKRRSEKYGAAYGMPLTELPKSAVRRITIYIILAVIAILCAFIARIFFGII